jgi:hypothetical protein
MTKDKYRPKGKKSQKSPQISKEKSPPVQTGGGCVVEDETQGKIAEVAKHTKKDEPEMGAAAKVWKGINSNANVVIAIFTVILALIGVVQTMIYFAQLDAMKKDQRPWLRVIFTPGTIQPLAPIGGTIQLINEGKTPAMGLVEGKFEVEKVMNGEKAKLDYALPFIDFETGMIVPGQKQEEMPIRRVAGDAGDVNPLSQSEYDDFNQLKIFFVVYGTVSYGDFFGTRHWTKFCSVLIPHGVPPNTPYTGRSCSVYSDVDGN